MKTQDDGFTDGKPIQLETNGPGAVVMAVVSPGVIKPAGSDYADPPEVTVRNESVIVLEVSRERKGAYVRAARPGTLAAWIFDKLDAASGYLSPEFTAGVKKMGLTSKTAPPRPAPGPRNERTP